MVQRWSGNRGQRKDFLLPPGLEHRSSGLYSGIMLTECRALRRMYPIICDTCNQPHMEDDRLMKIFFDENLKKEFGLLRLRWENYIKMDFEEIRFEVTD